MENVCVMDSDEQVEMLNYKECDNVAPVEVKKARGIVVDKTTKHQIVGSFGYTETYSKEDEDLLGGLFTQESLSAGEWGFSYSLESTLLRIFYHHDQWYLVTHKKLDAFKSRWSCRSTFGELFVESLSRQTDKKSEEVLSWLHGFLDQEKVYCFLLKCNQENRIVCQVNPRRPRIVYLGSFLKGTEVVLDTSPLILEGEGVTQFARPEAVASSEVDSVTRLLEKVESLDYNEYQGILAVHIPTQKFIKILNAEYKKYYDLRGNNPNLRFRYLEIRNDSERVRMLYFLYPKSAEVFDQLEDTVRKISRMIYHFYVNRYIKNQFITLPKEEFQLMKKCHNWYLEDRKNNRIFSQKVLEIMASEEPLHLYKMIRRFTLNQNMAMHQTMNTKRMYMDTSSSAHHIRPPHPRSFAGVLTAAAPAPLPPSPSQVTSPVEVASVEANTSS